MSIETISAGHLKAIDEVLALEAPDLRHHVVSIGRRGPLPFLPQRGQSIYHDYPVEMRADDAAAILSVLVAAEKKHGAERKFFGFQVNLLTTIWSGHVARLRAKPE